VTQVPPKPAPHHDGAFLRVSCGDSKHMATIDCAEGKSPKHIPAAPISTAPPKSIQPTIKNT
jgi:hypothetical protein